MRKKSWKFRNHKRKNSSHKPKTKPISKTIFEITCPLFSGNDLNNLIAYWVMAENIFFLHIYIYIYIYNSLTLKVLVWSALLKLFSKESSKRASVYPICSCDQSCVTPFLLKGASILTLDTNNFPHSDVILLCSSIWISSCHQD